MIDKTFNSELGDIRVLYSEKIAKRAIIIWHSLQSLRGLKQTALITALHESVISLMLKGFGRGQQGNEEVVALAVRFIQDDNDNLLQRALNDALETAMLENNFAPHAPIRFANLDVGLAPNWYDQTEQNEERAMSMYPPLNPIAIFHPDEQKCALIQALKQRDVRFNGWFIRLFDEVAKDMAERLRGEIEASYEGKSKSGVAADTPVEPRAVSDRRQRRGSKRQSSLPSDDDRTTDGQTDL